MDTRIEELCACIIERCETYGSGKIICGLPCVSDKAVKACQIANHAREIINLLDEYRAEHPEEY